jgi:ribokinase
MLADVVIANEMEFELFAGKNGLEDAARQAEMLRINKQTGQTMIVTLGADGVMAVRDGKVVRVSSLKIDPVDTVGAGDTFCGYLVAGLDQRLDFERSLRRAAVAGSLACTKPGAQPSIPLAREVDEHI